MNYNHIPATTPMTATPTHPPSLFAAANPVLVDAATVNEVELAVDVDEPVEVLDVLDDEVFEEELTITPPLTPSPAVLCDTFWAAAV
jgi:hypothetical protein